MAYSGRECPGRPGHERDARQMGYDDAKSEAGAEIAALRAQLRQAKKERDRWYADYQRINKLGAKMCSERDEARAERNAAIKRAEAAERRLKYHHASYPLPKKPPQPVQLGDDYNPDLCRFCREADWEAPAEAQVQQKEGSDG